MYTAFFQLRELPFNNTPDPRFFYSTPDHEEAVASLIYAVQARKGFVLLTGEIGAGKTLVSRMMLRHFGQRIVFAHIAHAVPGASDLLESVCTEFELSPPPGSTQTQLVRRLHDFLLEQFSQDTPTVLVLDEAQNLSPEAFEQLRMIGNLEADDAKLLQICIVGQPELQRTFASPQLRQLRQRIFRCFHLPALDRKHAEGYIRRRLEVAGASGPDPFTPDAIDRIAQISRGLPRLINAVCDNAMLSAYAADRRQIDGPFIASVIDQMMPNLHDANATAPSKQQLGPRSNGVSNEVARRKSAVMNLRNGSRQRHPARTDAPILPADSNARLIGRIRSELSALRRRLDVSIQMRTATIAPDAPSHETVGVNARQTSAAAQSPDADLTNERVLNASEDYAADEEILTASGEVIRRGVDLHSAVRQTREAAGELRRILELAHP